MIKIFLLIFLSLASGTSQAAFQVDWGVSALVCTIAAIGIDALTLGTATPIMVALGASLGLHVCGISLVWQGAVASAPPILNVTIATDNQVTPSTPAGWIGPTVPPTFVPIPPGVPPVAPSFQGWSNFSSGIKVGPSASTSSAVIDQIMLSYGDQNWYSVNDAYPELIMENINSHVITKFLVTSDPPCAQGYKLSLSTDECEVQTPTLVMKPSDGRCDILKVAGVYRVDPQDPDCSSVPATGLGTNVLVIPGVNGGSSFVLSGDTAAGGSVMLNGYDASVNKTQRVTTHVSSSGIIDSVDQSTLDGNLTTEVPGSGSGTGTGTTFPSDYAKSGEALAAANKLATDLLKTSVAPGDPAFPESAQFDSAFFQTTFDTLKAWQLPAHTSQCPTADFTAFDKSFTFNSHCALITDHWGALQAVMILIWTLSGLMVVLRA